MGEGERRGPKFFSPPPPTAHGPPTCNRQQALRASPRRQFASAPSLPTRAWRQAAVSPRPSGPPSPAVSPALGASIQRGRRPPARISPLRDGTLLVASPSPAAAAAKRCHYPCLRAIGRRPPFNPPAAGHVLVARLEIWTYWLLRQALILEGSRLSLPVKICITC